MLGYAMKNLWYDSYFGSYANQFALHAKHKPGKGYNPPAFMNRKEYDTAIGNLQNEFSKKIKNK